MSNPMKYIKSLEAAGFARKQAEAQVQMVLDAIEGDLVTKADFAVFQERIENRLAQSAQQFEHRLAQSEQQIESRLIQSEQRFENRLAQSEHRFENRLEQTDRRIVETEFRLLTRLGFLVVSTTSIAVAVLTWLIKT